MHIAGIAVSCIASSLAFSTTLAYVVSKNCNGKVTAILVDATKFPQFFQ